MLNKSTLIILMSTVLLSGAACTRSQTPNTEDNSARNMEVPARSESTTADVERREEGMTGATNTTDQNDSNPQHSNRREAARTGEQNKGRSTTSEVDASGNTGSGTTGNSTSDAEDAGTSPSSYSK